MMAPTTSTATAAIGGRRIKQQSVRWLSPTTTLNMHGAMADAKAFAYDQNGKHNHGREVYGKLHRRRARRAMFM
jgi:hypothetical protein